jgi:hypothetical protein
MLRKLVLVILVFAVVGALAWYFLFSSRVVLGPAASIMNNAESIGVFRLEPDEYGGFGLRTYAKNVPGYFEDIPLKATANVATLGGDYKERAASALRSAVVTYPKEMSTCILKPGVAFRFTRGNESATIFLCYYCSDGFVLVRDGTGLSTYTRKYRFVKSHEGLLNILKETFPDNPDIAKLVAAKGELPHSRPAD